MSMTVKQLADSLGVSKTAIRKRITANFRANYVETTANGVLIVNDEGCKLIAETLQTTENGLRKPPQPIAETTENPEIKLLETTIATLQQQLAVKDNQIAALNEQLISVSQSLQDTSSALAAAQALHAGTMQQIAEQANSEHKSFWKRIFKKDK